ncbi:hypothetical protein A2767_01195 [Candidatus Roizmanbacteria bacterium RIFCSPHIGHO2_01_FULL_35_10]|uniref:Uncharacterized protein n=1 Tax=Candidatus Roizmanbacteria bacterium RIFCSPLOWO2_01_FULL_35_13 TaxID=1802055 RepID=A0A1F7IC17_9BACT|nr:MAG: hypothetical protein A2767_01195 [Candidatus Roizmanbacteria bacterium RIFCSPHIGHO2_01_FULL_35_10]OGK40897.1 MAG: hypothetical protein A3A74_01565 [Candidatus Roizmanbacteria bacterium RIFCSPLOWO2_01_FULL_35_13]
MSKDYSNLCVRCGKQRIIVKTWKEKLGYSTITATMTACPDKECQKIVDANNKKQKAKQDALKLRSNQRLQARRRK